MKNNKNLIIGVIVAFIVILGGFAIFTMDKSSEGGSQTTTEDMTEQTTQQAGGGSVDIGGLKRIPEVTDEIKLEIDKFNQILDQFYVTTWAQETNEYLSSYSYMINGAGEQMDVTAVAKAMAYELPKELEGLQIHFVKPKSLIPYLGDNIVIVEPDDAEILSVYSAVPVDDGVYISSVYDKGMVITDEQYRNFVLEHSWIHGEVRNPKPEEEDYKAILKVIEAKDTLLKDGNIKHLAVDDKYGVIVISSKDDPAYIKQYALEKKDGNWGIIVEGLESVNQKRFVNYAYTDFELGLLPKYDLRVGDIAITSNLEGILEQIKQSGDIGEDEVSVYSCGAGNFMYFEFESGKKVLLHTDLEGITNIYEVDNYKTALGKMLELEENPPVYILKFEN